MASPHNAPVARDKSTTIRKMGNPRPGFCVRACGQAAWFAGVSAVSSVVPSPIFTCRCSHSQSAGRRDSSSSPAAYTNRRSTGSGSFARARQ